MPICCTILKTFVQLLPNIVYFQFSQFNIKLKRQNVTVVSYYQIMRANDLAEAILTSLPEN